MSTTNPLLTSLIPGGNPSGSQVSLPYGTSGGSTVSGQNPLMPQVPSGPNAPAMPYSNSTFSAYSSPYTSTSGSPAVPNAPSIPGGLQTAGSPGAPGSSPSSTSLTQGEQTSLNTTLSKDYGSGIAGLIEQFLAGGAGFNQQAVNQLIAAMGPQNEQNQQNLLNSFSASGNRFSSGAQIGDAALLSQESLNAGQIEAQMYEQSVSDYISVLMGAATGSATRINQPTFWDQLLTGGQQAAGTVASSGGG